MYVLALAFSFEGKALAAYDTPVTQLDFRYAQGRVEYI